jgi:hypothetical protein
MGGAGAGEKGAGVAPVLERRSDINGPFICGTRGAAAPPLD